jgi:hypothetical protein
MGKRGGLAALVVLASLATTAWGQVKREWKLQKGDVFYAETVTTLKGTASEEGKAGARQPMLVSVSTVVIRFTVKDVTSAGYVLEEKFMRARQKTSGGVIGVPLASVLLQLVFNSEKPQDRDKDIRFTLTVSPAGKVVDFKGYEEAIRILARGMKKITPDVDAGVIKNLKSLVTEESLKKVTQQVFVGFPQQAKKEWQHSEIDSLGPLGRLEGRYRYESQGTRRGQEQIRVEAQMKYLPPEKLSDSLPFKITGGRLAADRANGMIHFDTQAGRLVRLDLKIHFKGTLNVEAGGRKATLHLDQEQTVVTRVLSRNPIP